MVHWLLLCREFWGQRQIAQGGRGGWRRSWRKRPLSSGMPRVWWRLPELGYRLNLVCKLLLLNLSMAERHLRIAQTLLRCVALSIDVMWCDVSIDVLWLDVSSWHEVANRLDRDDELRGKDLHRISILYSTIWWPSINTNPKVFCNGMVSRLSRLQTFYQGSIEMTLPVMKRFLRLHVMLLWFRSRCKASYIKTVNGVKKETLILFVMDCRDCKHYTQGQCNEAPCNE